MDTIQYFFMSIGIFSNDLPSKYLAAIKPIPVPDIAPIITLDGPGTLIAIPAVIPIPNPNNSYLYLSKVDASSQFHPHFVILCANGMK